MSEHRDGDLLALEEMLDLLPDTPPWLPWAGVVVVVLTFLALAWLACRDRGF